jgi:hypothetical protein
VCVGTEVIDIVARSTWGEQMMDASCFIEEDGRE